MKKNVHVMNHLCRACIIECVLSKKAMIQIPQISGESLKDRHRHIYQAFMNIYADRIINKENMVTLVSESELWRTVNKSNIIRSRATMLAYQYFEEVLIYTVLSDQHGYREAHLKLLTRWYRLPNILNYVQNTLHFRRYLVALSHYKLPDLVNFYEAIGYDYSTEWEIVKRLKLFDPFVQYLEYSIRIDHSFCQSAVKYLFKRAAYGLAEDYKKYYNYFKQNIDIPEIYIIVYNSYPECGFRNLLEYATPSVDKLLIYFRYNTSNSDEILRLIRTGNMKGPLTLLCTYDGAPGDIIEYIIDTHTQILVELVRYNPHLIDDTPLGLYDLFIRTLIPSKNLVEEIIKVVGNREIEIRPYNPYLLPYYKDIKISLNLSDEANAQQDIIRDCITSYYSGYYYVGSLRNQYKAYITQCIACEDYQYMDMIVAGNVKLSDKCIFSNKDYLTYISTNRDIYLAHYNKFKKYGINVADTKTAFFD